MVALLDPETALKFVQALGWVKGTFLLFFWVAHGWIWWLYRARLKDRQKQIDSLAEENKEYRNRFLSIMDRHFDYSNNHVSPQNEQSRPSLPSPPTPATSANQTVHRDEQESPVTPPEKTT